MIRYLSDKILAKLRGDIDVNLKRYRETGFADLKNEPGWDVPLGIEFDAEKLKTLDLSKPRNVSFIDLANSKVVGEALSGLSPSIANEERVWARLSHIEAFEYSRVRWLEGVNEDKHAVLINKHFFASTQTGIRDDHAVSRLWWNYHIARTCAPDDIDSALDLILTTADIRSNFVERIWMTSRQRIAGAVLRAMKSDPWITGAEQNFREFMKSLNRLGGGIVFEALSDADCNAFVAECVALARMREAA